jgi:hypothetical protein
MASTPAATARVCDADADDFLLDLSNFFEEAGKPDALGYVGTFLKMSTKQDPFADNGTFLRAVNYDDHILADLAAFLEMATYDDPIDDLVPFLDRPCCVWSSQSSTGYPILTRSPRARSKQVQLGPEGTFYLFSELPHGIRAMIWELCIPVRVQFLADCMHEVPVGRPERLQSGRHLMTALVDHYSDPSQPLPTSGSSNIFIPDFLRGAELCCPTKVEVHHDCSCIIPPVHTDPTRQKLPVIAQVNREARTEVLRRRSVASHLVSVQGRTNNRLPIRFHKNNILLINTDCFDLARHSQSSAQRRVDCLSDFVNRSKGIEVAIFCEALLGGPLSLYRALTGVGQVQLVVGVLRFGGLSDNEAAVTGLFGPFGEELVALIPAKNSILRKLYTAHVSFRPECMADCYNPFDIDRVQMLMKSKGSFRDMLQNWPTLREYCGAMRGLAHSLMTDCEGVLMRRSFDGPNAEMQGQTWRQGMSEFFKSSFVPVYLVHRGRNPVLVDAEELAGPP